MMYVKNFVISLQFYYISICLGSFIRSRKLRSRRRFKEFMRAYALYMAYPSNERLRTLKLAIEKLPAPAKELPLAMYALHRINFESCNFNKALDYVRPLGERYPSYDLFKIQEAKCLYMLKEPIECVQVIDRVIRKLSPLVPLMVKWSEVKQKQRHKAQLKMEHQQDPSVWDHVLAFASIPVDLKWRTLIDALFISQKLNAQIALDDREFSKAVGHYEQALLLCPDDEECEKMLRYASEMSAIEEELK